MIAEIFWRAGEARAQDSNHVTQDPDKFPKRLLFRAIRSNNLKAVKSLVEAGALIKLNEESVRTAKDIAFEQGNLAISQYLVLAIEARRKKIENKQSGYISPRSPAAPPPTGLSVTAVIHQSRPEAAPLVTIIQPGTFEKQRESITEIQRAEGSR